MDLHLFRVDEEGRLVQRTGIGSPLPLKPGETFAASVEEDGHIALVRVNAPPLEKVVKDPAWAFWDNPEDAEYDKYFKR